MVESTTSYQSNAGVLFHASTKKREIVVLMMKVGGNGKPTNAAEGVR